MILITPLTALAPQTAAPGPRTTSMRSISFSSVSCLSQNTPEKVGEYTVRPSIKTSNLLENRPLKPRAVIAHLLASMRATCTPGTMRSNSGMVVTPERRISVSVMTNTAAAVSARRWGVLEATDTSIFTSSSILNCFNSAKRPLSAARVTWLLSKSRTRVLHSGLVKSPDQNTDRYLYSSGNLKLEMGILHITRRAGLF